ncbi:MAG: GAF domain-containing protein [Gammaproteobacteria bacterium]|nr:GAF domain-containing protein [Gammaproteobacteria bacterium]
MLESKLLDSIIGNISKGLQLGASKQQVAWLVIDNLSLLGLEDCSIYLNDPDKNQLIQEAANNKETKSNRALVSPHTLQIGKGIVGTAASLQQHIIVDNTELTPNYVLDESLGKSEMSVPIVFENKLLGVIDSESPKESFYQQPHLRIFELVAVLVAPWLYQATNNNEKFGRRKSDTQKASAKYGLSIETEKLKKQSDQYLHLSYEFFSKVERKDYNEVMHQFLKHYTKPEPLKYVPALEAVLDSFNNPPFKVFIVERLKDLIKLGIDEIYLPSPKTQKYHFIIEHTYINPLANHQTVADRLGMSYSTFARHLGKARNGLVDHVWQKIHQLISRKETV